MAGNGWISIRFCWSRSRKYEKDTRNPILRSDWLNSCEKYEKSEKEEKTKDKHPINSFMLGWLFPITPERNCPIKKCQHKGIFWTTKTKKMTENDRTSPNFRPIWLISERNLSARHEESDFEVRLAPAGQFGAQLGPPGADKNQWIPLCLWVFSLPII